MASQSYLSKKYYGLISSTDQVHVRALFRPTLLKDLTKN
jgi:hypothetical protein